MSAATGSSGPPAAGPPPSPSRVDADHSPQVIAVASVFIGLEIGIVLLRFSTRAAYKTKWGLDDWLIPPALLFCLGMCIIAIVEAKIAGVGRHLDVLYVYDPKAIVNWAKCGYAIEQIYCVAVALPKLSILATYQRIFTTKPYRYTAWAVGVIISATAIAGVITSLASCKPFSARWNPLLFTSHCINAPNFWKGLSVPNLFTDIVMLVLPMPAIWKLHVDRKQKLALIGIFALGSLGMISAIIRLVAAVRIGDLSDGTWVSADIAIWSTIEPGCYLIAACLPVLRPLFIGIGKQIKSTVRSTRYGSQTDKRRGGNDSEYTDKSSNNHHTNNSNNINTIQEANHRNSSLEKPGRTWRKSGQSDGAESDDTRVGESHPHPLRASQTWQHDVEANR